MTIEMAAFLVTYVIPFVYIDTNWVGFTISTVIFIACGIAFIASNRHFLNPTFLFLGYKLYRIGDNYVLCKYSIDKLKLSILENPDGINARELVHNTYIIMSR